MIELAAIWQPMSQKIAKMLESSLLPLVNELSLNEPERQFSMLGLALVSLPVYDFKDGHCTISKILPLVRVFWQFFHVNCTLFSISLQSNFDHAFRNIISQSFFFSYSINQSLWRLCNFVLDKLALPGRRHFGSLQTKKKKTNKKQRTKFITFEPHNSAFHKTG